MSFLPRHFDWILLLATLALISLGILMISSTALGESRNYDLAVRQGLFAVAGITLFFIIARSDIEIWRSLAWVFYAASVVLLVAVFIYGLEVRGSLRWIDLGFFRLQPSELVKITTILVLAHFLSSRNMRSLKNIFISALLALIPAILIFLQPDLGSALILGALWIGMMIPTEIPKKYFFMGGALILVSLPVVYNLLQPYQKDRLLTFFNPGSDPLGVGYNVIQSTIAVGSGGLLGRGFGRGTQSHLNFLPEHHTDFIFATLAEELGLLGAALLLLLLGIVIWRLLFGALRLPRFGGFVLIGLMVLIFFQAVVNIGMNIGLVPVTGITLPFVSYGGSSLMTLLAGLGLAQAALRRKKLAEVVDEPE
ncbi:MAG TPA: rod shape-determining protein RodA [Patescibacteria group bacterium]|nr:rod shape-determining protein RodA [Patescibacteria group bacterium]